MSERPITFTAPMIRAIVDGCKTETRRVLQVQPPNGAWPFFIMCSTVRSDERKWQFRESKDHLSQTVGEPFRIHRPGDLLWVQEAHRLAIADPTRRTYAVVEYVADGQHRHVTLTDREAELAWARQNRPPRNIADARVTSPRFMYRSLSRLNLRVKAVRVERLHEIDDGGAFAEGCNGSPTQTPNEQYEELWESIHGPGSWSINPWVSVTSFEVWPSGCALSSPRCARG